MKKTETISIDKLILETLQQLLAVAHRLEGALYAKPSNELHSEPTTVAKTVAAAIGLGLSTALQEGTEELPDIAAYIQPAGEPAASPKTRKPRAKKEEREEAPKPPVHVPVAVATATQVEVDDFGLGL